MKKNFSDRIGPALSVISLVVIAVTYGIVATWWNWFPAPQIGQAHSTMKEIATNWKNDVGLEPTRHLVKPQDGETDPNRGLSGVPDNDGYTLIAGLNEKEGETFHIVRLYDGAGKEVHRWPVHYDLLDEERKPQNVMLHGMEVFEDGSLALTFDGGAAIARVDACGKPMWKQNDRYHHSINRDGKGNLVTLVDDDITRLDENTGEILSRISIAKEMVEGENADQKSLLRIRTRTPENADEEVSFLADPYHPNDAEPLRPEMAGAFPMFEVGDVLLSLRELNMITVVDPLTGKMKWWHYGPWFKQHDPDFQPDGSITVYDNATGDDRSRIISVRPGDDTTETLFEGSEEVPFYSWRRGKHQILPNGNILLTEAEGGRVMEVTPDGQQVWERHLAWDDTQNVIITEARYIPNDFFDNGVPDCTK